MRKGVDLSVYNTGITYHQLATWCDFAMIRMSQGTTIKDGMAPTHVEGCIAAGIPWGGYHFFVSQTPAATQAVYFMGMLTHFPRPQIPPMLDVEKEDPLGWAHLASVSVDCLRMIEGDSTFASGIYYCNLNFARNLPGFPFTRTVGIDLAAPTSTPGTVPHIIRQLAPQKVVGAPGTIDVDEYLGTTAQFAQFISTQGDTVPLSANDVVAQWTIPGGAGWFNLLANGALDAQGTGATLGALTYVACSNDGGRYHFGPNGDHTAGVFSYDGLPAADQNVPFPKRYFVAMQVYSFNGVPAGEGPIGLTGPPGPAGPQGPVGPQGPPATNAAIVAALQAAAKDLEGA